MSFELPTIKWHDATGRVKAEVKPLVSDVETRIACVRRLLDNRRNLGNDVVAANKSFEAGKLRQRIILNFCCANLTFILATEYASTRSRFSSVNFVYFSCYVIMILYF